MGGGDAVKAQTLEPEFEGEVVGVFPDGSSKKLEKHNVRMRTGAGVYIAGFAASKSKTKVLVEGGSRIMFMRMHLWEDMRILL